MAMRKICPDAVRGWRSRGPRTQPTPPVRAPPSIAACFAGSTRAAKMASAGALMVVLALIVSLANFKHLLSQALEPYESPTPVGASSSLCDSRPPVTDEG